MEIKIINTNRLPNINQKIIYTCQRAVYRLIAALLSIVLLLSLSTSYAQATPSGQDGNGIADTTELREEKVAIDSDGDGISDEAETLAGTNPNKADSDNDTLSDGSEILIYGTDPLSLDTDNDQLGDSLEVITYNTDPNNPDTDNDGLLDGRELTIHLSNPSNSDTDSDGIMDGLEVENGTSPLDPTDNKPCEECVEATEQNALGDKELDENKLDDEDSNIVGSKLGVTDSDTVDSDTEADIEKTIEKPVIIASTHTVSPGSKVAIILEGSALSNLGTATIDIIYDGKVLEPVECNLDPEDKFNMVHCNMEFVLGEKMSFNVTSLSGVTGDSRIAEIVFNVIGTDGDLSDIEVNLITIADTQGNNLLFTAVNGHVAVSEACANDGDCGHDLNTTDTTSNLESDEIDIKDTTDADEKGAEISTEIGQVQVLNTANASGKIFLAEIPAGTTGTVAVPVMLQDGVDVGTLSIELLYDDAKVRATDCIMGEGIELGECNHKFERGTVRFNAVSTKGMSGDLMLAEVTFELLTPTEKTLNLELDIESAVDIHGTNFVQM